MENKALTSAIEKLSAVFAARNWKYLDVPAGSPKEKTYAWPGRENEDIMVCVHKGPIIREMFHRQDFFFFNFAYKGDYGAISYKYDNHIVIREGECYIGQPYAGYALYSEGTSEVIIIGVLVRKDTFFRAFLPALSSDEKLFKFFLDPQTDEYSQEFIHLGFDDDFCVRSFLEMMVVEHANQHPDTQQLLRPMVLTLFMLVARQYKKTYSHPKDESLTGKIICYINEYVGAISLKEVAAKFSYHPNYLSSVLHKQTGKTFSQLLLQQRMERASVLLKATDLSIEEIAAMLGYNDTSNFYKAFKEYFGTSPRKY